MTGMPRPQEKRREALHWWRRCTRTRRGGSGGWGICRTGVGPDEVGEADELEVVGAGSNAVVLLARGFRKRGFKWGGDRGERRFKGGGVAKLVMFLDFSAQSGNDSAEQELITTRLAIPSFLFPSPQGSLTFLFVTLSCSLLHLMMMTPKGFSLLTVASRFRDKVTGYLNKRFSALRATKTGHGEKSPPQGDPSLVRWAYAYAPAVGGIIYTVTDVEELGEWMKGCLENHPMLEALTAEELENDLVVVKLLTSATEEGQKVARNGGRTFQAVYRRVAL
ncbi:hypothetical protein NL676_017253 [Syzygium grande]|nr:hypothetical protein NL676_017253 [Syzygium grande]